MKYILPVCFLLTMFAGSSFLWADSNDVKSEPPVDSPVEKLQGPSESKSNLLFQKSTSLNTSSQTRPISSTSAPDVASLSNWPLVLATLFGMICLILVLAWAVRRFGGVNFSKNREMRLVSSLTVGTRERVSIVEAGGQKFLLGITAQNINHLHTFDDEAIFDKKTGLVKESTFDEDDSLDRIPQSKYIDVEQMKGEFADKLKSVLKTSAGKGKDVTGESQK